MLNADDRARLSAVGEFWSLLTRFSNVEGWIFGPEGYALMLYAANGPGRGAIVEIGSWMGLSTCWLAAGAQAAGREKVYAVDSFDGGPALKGQEIIRNEGTTYTRFIENIEAQGFLGNVEPIIASSQEAARRWNGGAIRLLFIDGEHTYEAVKQDFELWSAHLVAEGVVIFDDCSPKYPGVVRFCDELVAKSSYGEVLRVGKMRFFTRT
jgi:MMP 1-O-methyltransferase